MSATWYPVIDVEKCTECQACFNKCTHGVYELRGNRPVVVNPDGCVQGCTGCEKLCPTGAIDYVGRGSAIESSCGCSCGEKC